MRRTRLSFVRVAVVGAALLAAPPSPRAQDRPAPEPAPIPAPRADAPACYGFSFGPWTPALDWRRAGHDVALDSARTALAPGGRAWAASQLASDADSTLMLFPPWWPAGVWVTLGRARLAVGDTVLGSATALVGDGRLKPSTSRVRAWRLSCGG